MRAKVNPQVEELHRLSRFKTVSHKSSQALGPELIEFFNKSVSRKRTKLGKIAECWEQLVPPFLSERCALESFNRGNLAVAVNSASHLYELRQLLVSGLEKQILLACKSAGLRKITLKSGQGNS
jgi:hypothetical protein